MTGTDMGDLGRARSRAWSLSPLTARLAVAFVVVALAAVAVLTVLTLSVARGGLSALVERQHEDTVQRVAALAGQAFEQSGSWDGADLQSAVAIAAAEGGSIAVFDIDGRSVELSPMADMPGMMRRMHGEAVGPLGPPIEAPVVVDGQTVGTVEVRLPVDDSARAEVQLRDALTRNVLAAAGLAGLLALLAASLVATRLTRPLVRLTGTVEAVAAGNHAARSGGGDAPGELGTLSRAVDRMADTLERQEQLRRALVADVAHELRTPLAIALAECDAIIDQVAAATPERLTSIRDEILRLARLVGDLEALAAAESAALHLAVEPLDLAQVTDDILALHATRLTEAGIELHTALHPAPVQGDPLRLGQIVTNLVTNAAKFTPPGGRIDVETRTDEHVTLTVTDDGPGIDDDEFDHVFERFWQGRAAADKGGSGIGLAVVTELARAHGGSIHVANVAGRGARFVVELPRR